MGYLPQVPVIVGEAHGVIQSVAKRVNDPSVA
jgi:hypothetical protein